jgi:hypothetical protein
MKTYEYQKVELSPWGPQQRLDEEFNKLNELGAKGWRLVSTVTTTSTDGATCGIIHTLEREREIFYSDKDDG